MGFSRTVHPPTAPPGGAVLSGGFLVSGVTVAPPCAGDAEKCMTTARHLGPAGPPPRIGRYPSVR